MAREGADPVPPYRGAGDNLRARSGHDGCVRASVEHHSEVRARRQADAMAELTVEEAEKWLVLDWDQPLRHGAWYKAVYPPAVLRANRLTPSAKLSLDQAFHSPRHRYASLCLAAGIRPIDIAELMGHRDVKTTLTVYAHLIDTDEHTGNMAALGAMGSVAASDNVVPLRCDYGRNA